MEQLRESFLKTYANIPINLRDEIILVMDNIGSLSWNVAYIEVKNKTELSNKILEELKRLDLI